VPGVLQQGRETPGENMNNWSSSFSSSIDFSRFLSITIILAMIFFVLPLPVKVISTADGFNPGARPL
jgi:preprotein translocase subunit SecG